MARQFHTADSAEDRWYYLEPGEVQPAGPLSVIELRKLADGKKIHKKSIVWRKGMNQWEPIENVPQLKPQKSIFSIFGFGRKAEPAEAPRVGADEA